jgi:hypothetical protein
MSFIFTPLSPVLWQFFLFCLSISQGTLEAASGLFQRGFLWKAGSSCSMKHTFAIQFPTVHAVARPDLDQQHECWMVLSDQASRQVSFSDLS